MKCTSNLNKISRRKKVAQYNRSPDKHSDFLDDGANSLRKTKSKVSIVKKISSGRIRNDVGKLSATELKLKYECEYNSHKNMKQRVKKTGGIVAPEFSRFSSFLLCMGAIPYDGHSLDRIDNHNPDYTPENCRWADKTDQANNRSTTKMLTHEGETLPAATWARRFGVKLNTLHSRLSRGWTHSEAITGIGVTNRKPPPPMPWRGLKQEQIEFEQRFQEDVGIASYKNRYEAYLDYIIKDGQADYETLFDCDFGYLKHIPRPQMDAIHQRHAHRSKLLEEISGEYENWKKQLEKPVTKNTQVSPEEEIWAFIVKARNQEPR